MLISIVHVQEFSHSTVPTLDAVSSPLVNDTDKPSREGTTISKMEQDEIWKDIPGLEGSYAASTLGRIKSLARIVSRGTIKQPVRERILTPVITEFGYAIYSIRKDGKTLRLFGHRLVLLTFVGPSDLICDHINHVRTDNRLSNLRYCTYRQNNSHRKKKSQSGYTGAFKNSNKSYRARINVNGKLITIGKYPTPEQAAEAYKEYLSKLVSNQPLANAVTLAMEKMKV